MTSNSTAAAGSLISIITPVYNEAETLPTFHSRLQSVMDAMNFPYEVIFVNDGSTDFTLNILLDLHQKDPKVKVLDFSRNFGKEIALTAGLDYAQGEAVIPIDADLQDPPELIPELVKKWQEGYDVVYATRELRQGESWFKRTTAKCFYRLIASITNTHIPQDTGDFRLMSRQVAASMKSLRERHRFMKGLFAWVGFKQTALLFNREPRLSGYTKWNYWKLWNFALEGITSFSNIPLQVASYLGLIISLLSLLYGAFLFARTLIEGNPVPGYPSLMVAILFLGGVQLMTLGVIGEYLGRIYDESKRRPLYILRSKYGSFSEGQKKAPNETDATTAN